jgi:hypothetical protein
MDSRKNGTSRAPRLARLAVSRSPPVFPRLLLLRTRFFHSPAPPPSSRRQPPLPPRRPRPLDRNPTRAPHRPLHRLIPSTQPASCSLCSTPSSPSIPRAAPVSSTATLPRAPLHPHRRSPRAAPPTSSCASSHRCRPAPPPHRRRPAPPQLVAVLRRGPPQIIVVLRLLPIVAVLRSRTRPRSAPPASTNCSAPIGFQVSLCYLQSSVALLPP